MGRFGVMRRAKDWVGLEVITLRDLSNHHYCIPKGTRCEVTYAHGGLHLSAEPCSKCGVKIFIRKIPYSDVRPVGPEDEQTS